MQKIEPQGEKKKNLAGDIRICRWTVKIFLEKTWKFDKDVGTVAL